MLTSKPGSRVHLRGAVGYAVNCGAKLVPWDGRGDAEEKSSLAVELGWGSLESRNCHSFVRERRAQGAGGRERGAWLARQEGKPVGHSLVANVTGCSVSQHHPLRSCINNYFSVQSLRGEREKNLSTGQHPPSFTSRVLLAGTSWVDAVSHTLRCREAPKARSVQPEAKGCGVMHGEATRVHT